MAKTNILVAAATLVGPKAKGETTPFRLMQGKELTAEAKKKLGLNADAVKDLIDRGHVVETEVRAAEGGKADTSELQARVKELEEQLEAATKLQEETAAKLAEATKAPA
ncbi:hypothetical protein [Novosphingobium mangrovi (ex Huang et al. 2023)]|uniref:Mu-like prophage FluMu N-terminal domain-containing protein n=1 Tax=Novosphingobium mangrovi (ex Huang et al. 2023) TaxID=2976432 RepID=A0ABT2I148_9SPHN|nr:hypothetical protein [Novosphingobium mangrovi (ex Huang et al. 2023)]MCT2398523.1 hypothetical protein [Novosphingobium mangrovi (ex Huang et al. 2023)]